MTFRILKQSFEVAGYVGIAVLVVSVLIAALSLVTGFHSPWFGDMQQPFLKIGVYGAAVTALCFFAAEQLGRRQAGQASVKRIAPPTQVWPFGRDITIRYTDHHGKTTERHIHPISQRYGTTAVHLEPQWLMQAVDLARGVDREFAMKDMVPLANPDA